MSSKTITLYVATKGDRSVGIWPVEDEIAVTIESGDPGGDEWEFEKYLCDCLSEWYDEKDSVSLNPPHEWEESGS
jgi:hypothetical protein